MNIVQRFLSKVKESGRLYCWNWQSSIDKWGYGKFRFGNKTLAHRASYSLFIGKIPSRLEIDHLCRNRACVNPGHLEAVPRLVNWQRGNSLSIIHATKTHCFQGHPYNDENTYLYKNKHRYCRKCNLRHVNKYKKSKTSATLKAAGEL